MYIERAGMHVWIASYKLQVSFAKEPYKRDDILQKRPTIAFQVDMYMEHEYKCRCREYMSCGWI